MKRRIWLMVTIAISVAGLGYAGFFLLAHEGGDQLTVSELKSQAGPFDQQVSVEGKVASGSIDWDNETRVMRFALTDARETISVLYRGIVPDSFKPDADLTVEGRYRPDGVFEASGFGSRRSVCAVCH